MKTISIRFNDHLANWIMGNCQRNKITISEFIRDLLYSKMQHGQIDHKLKINKQKYLQPQNYRTEMGYIIFAAKLIEGLVLATQEQGAELRTVAFNETEKLLSELNLNNNKNKEQRFCFNLDDALDLWLIQEGSRLQIVASQLIRNVIESAYLEDYLATESQRIELQKVSTQHQIIACKLLEALINHTRSGGETIIEEARNKSKEILLKLSNQNKSSVSA